MKVILLSDIDRVGTRGTQASRICRREVRASGTEGGTEASGETCRFGRDAFDILGGQVLALEILLDCARSGVHWPVTAGRGK